MSIEQALTENTSAIHALIAAIKAGTPTTAGQVAAVVAKAHNEIPTAAIGSAQPEVAENTGSRGAPDAPSLATASGSADTSSPAAASAIPYEQVKATIIKMASARGRGPVADLLKDFGVTNGKDLKPEQYAPFLEKAAL